MFKLHCLKYPLAVAVVRTGKETQKLIRRRMLAQHFFQVHFALTSKDISAVFDRLNNQESENKACDLSARLAEPCQFTNKFYFLVSNSLAPLTKCTEDSYTSLVQIFIGKKQSHRQLPSIHFLPLFKSGLQEPPWGEMQGCTLDTSLLQC